MTDSNRSIVHNNIIKPFELSDNDFNLFSRLVYENCGINLHSGKKELLRARLSKRLREMGFNGFRQYYKYLTKADSGQELINMLDAISTNLSSFFREKKHFEFLEQHVYPLYRDMKKQGIPLRLRLWSAGCASGEEPYTLAISLLEHLIKDTFIDVKILATDISTRSLEVAKKGIYSTASLKNVTPDLLKKYFQKGYGKWDDHYKIKEVVTRLVEFRRLNLIENFPFKNQFDFIFCRNVMIYFDQETKKKLVGKLYDYLKTDGYLFVGFSESLTGTEHHFQYVNPTVYQKSSAAWGGSVF